MKQFQSYPSEARKLCNTQTGKVVRLCQNDKHDEDNASYLLLSPQEGENSLLANLTTGAVKSICSSTRCIVYNDATFNLNGETE